MEGLLERKRWACLLLIRLVHELHNLPLLHCSTHLTAFPQLCHLQRLQQSLFAELAETVSGITKLHIQETLKDCIAEDHDAMTVA